MKKPDYEWWIKHSHTDSAFLLVCEDPYLFEQAVKSRLTEVGRPEDQGIINQALWRAIHEQDRFGSMASILAAIQPIPEGPEPRPFWGNLRTDRRAIRDDHGPFPMVGLSAFWAPYAVQHDTKEIDTLAEYAVGCGMTYVRWFGAHDWPGGVNPKTTPNYFSLMDKTIKALGERGLRSEITLFTRHHMIADPNEMAKEWAEVVNDNRNKVCLVEIVNEWNHSHNDWADNDVREAGVIFKEHCGAPTALSAPSAATWQDMEERLHHLYARSPADVTTIHFPRRSDTAEGEWRWVRQPWHARHKIGSCPPLAVDNEHQRWDKSGDNVAVAASALITAFIAGCAMSTHHDIYGVHIDRGPYVQHPKAGQLMKVLSTVIPLLPDDLPNWESCRVGAGGGPHPFPNLLQQHWSFEDIDEGVSRAFAAVQGDKFAMTLTGVKGGVTLHEVQAKPYRVISLENGETIAETNGPIRLSAADGEAFYVATI